MLSCFAAKRCGPYHSRDRRYVPQGTNICEEGIRVHFRQAAGWESPYPEAAPTSGAQRGTLVLATAEPRTSRGNRLGNFGRYRCSIATALADHRAAEPRIRAVPN